MAFDGIITGAIAKEIQSVAAFGKIDKIYQPEKDELVLHIHTKSGGLKLYASVNSSYSSVYFTDESLPNPSCPRNFCMLMRKHLQGGRIADVRQKGAERIIEISIETQSELGFSACKKLIFEIMGKHSNIVLVDMDTGKIIDSIKHISIDVNRIRQILPGKKYEYPPVQDKTPFREATKEDMDALEPNPSVILSRIGGISPALARELAVRKEPYAFLRSLVKEIDGGDFKPHIYINDKGDPVEFHIADLSEYEGAAERMDFDSLSRCLCYFYSHKVSSGRLKQKSHDLVKTVSAHINRLYLKKQRLLEDIKRAEDSEDLRLCGQLLTSNLHLIKPGDKYVEVVNYYDGMPKRIALSEKYSPAKNAQQYFKRYGKAKTALKEKRIQLEGTEGEIGYLQSVLTYLDQVESAEDIGILRTELEETGYAKKKKTKERGKKYTPKPYRYETSDGFSVLAGRNNKENDFLTLRTALKTDLWLHAQDIPGSHVIVRTGGREISETAIREAAAVAAYHSRGRGSENVPVDYVRIKYVKKPSGAKPGMVIFTNNRTVWVNPALPGDGEKQG